MNDDITDNIIINDVLKFPCEQINPHYDKLLTAVLILHNLSIRLQYFKLK